MWLVLKLISFSFTGELKLRLFIVLEARHYIEYQENTHYPMHTVVIFVFAVAVICKQTMFKTSRKIVVKL